MGNATATALAGIAIHQALTERDAETRRRTLDDVVTRLEGFQVDPDVIQHFRTLRDATR